VCVVDYSEDCIENQDYVQYLSTHDNINIDIPCIKTNDLNVIKNTLSSYDIILINEGQFFENLYEEVLELIEFKNKIVHICGLDGDYKRNEFGDMLRLIPKCDKIVKLTACCNNCEDKKAALFSYRTNNEKDVKFISDTDYIPVCRSCYLYLTKI
jgi:thymidine kinase